MPESANKGGRIPRVTDEDLLDVFRSTSDPVLSTAEVAEAVPIQRRGVLNRLRDLEDGGQLASKSIGGRNTVWWVVAEAGESGAQAAPEPDTTDAPGDTPDTDTDAESTPSTGVSEWFPDLRAILPGGGANLDARVQAVREIHDYLKEHGSGQKSDFEAVVDAEATGYGGDDTSPFDSFWTNCVNNTGVLGELPGVESPGEGGHTYQYQPEGATDE